MRELSYFPIVKPVLDLMRAKQWSTLLALGRWTPFFDQMPEDVREGMPPPGHSHFDDVSADPDHLHLIADKVKSWAPTLLS